MCLPTSAGGVTMPFHFADLDDQTRRFMLDEVEQDLANNNLYLSPRLSEAGLRDYPDALRTASRSGNEVTLATVLRGSGRIRQSEERRTRSGRITIVRVPVTAPETLAEGEFNRFYARGLCRRALAEGVKEVEIYRAKEVASPRPESQTKIGRRIDAAQLLLDSRSHPGVEPALGLPPGPNSGLSVRLP